MKSKKIVMGIVTLVLTFTLSACASDSKETSPKENMEKSSEKNMEMDHSNMNHSGSAEVPKGLNVAENPTYEVRSQAIINAEHMSGMNGAEATISGAFDTTVYTVTYTPTTGGEPVEDHKWVIHEEIKNSGDEPFQPGDEVVLNAEHMEGMDDASASIDTAEQTTVYMVDYTPTTGGEKVTNHKWVTESELSAK
jgi:uncharacterized protein YceK